VFGVTSTTKQGPSELAVLWQSEVGDYVAAAAIVVDGELAVLGLGDGAIVGIDLGTGRERFRRQAHFGGVLCVSPSPTGGQFATCGSDPAAKVWTSDGELVRGLPGSGTAWVEHVAWSPTGRHLATAAGRSVRVWDAEGRIVAEPEAVESTVTALAWRPDGTAIAATCYGGVRFWSVEASAVPLHLAWKGSLLSVAWSPDAKIIACASQDRSVHFWRLDAQADSEMSGYPLKPKALAWDSESRLLATSGDIAATLWDFRGKGPEGSTPIQLHAHTGAITCLAFSPRKGFLASGAKDAAVVLWEPRRQPRPIRHAKLRGEITTLSWHPRKRGLLATDDRGTTCFLETL